MNNIANSNSHGIDLRSSNNNTFTCNTANSNIWGISLRDSENNELTNNTMSGNKYNIYIDGRYTHDIDTSNLVDGKPIYYWVNQQDQQVPNDAGFVGLVNSTNITVKDLTLTMNQKGMLLVDTTDSRIENVNASNNYYGIYLSRSSDNTLTNNTANFNNKCGINLYSSSNNIIYNNYFNNTNNAYDDGNNTWGIAKTAGTNILGGSWLGGNYWSDYTAEDSDAAGIGDTMLSYTSSGDVENGGDWLPLVKPSAP